MFLNLEQIRTDGGTQPRASLRTDIMEEYAEAMRGGARFPAVTVFFDGTDYWLADGFHRVGAHCRARPADPIEVEVQQGTQRDAQWYSFGANKDHGLRRDSVDTRRAIETILGDPKWGEMPQNQIAAHVGVSPAYVSKVKASINSVNRCAAPRTVVRKGRTYQMDTARIGQRHKRSGAISPKAQAPIREHSKPAPKTALELPHDPEWAARTLISVFDRPFLESLVAAITQHLQGAQA